MTRRWTVLVPQLCSLCSSPLPCNRLILAQQQESCLCAELYRLVGILAMNKSVSSPMPIKCSHMPQQLAMSSQPTDIVDMSECAERGYEGCDAFFPDFLTSGTMLACCRKSAGPSRINFKSHFVTSVPRTRAEVTTVTCIMLTESLAPLLRFLSQYMQTYTSCTFCPLISGRFLEVPAPRCWPE